MMVANVALLTAVDRIYESVEHPELWPETIEAIGELIGGRPGFWTPAEAGSAGPGINGETTDFVLSRSDLRVLDRYAEEFGELIVRFLKIIFLSILWSPAHVGGREATGLRMAQRFLPRANSGGGPPSPPAAKSGMRNLIAALWEDCQPFSVESLELLRLLAPHFERAMRLQMRVIEQEFRADMLSASLDRLALGVVLIDRLGLPVWVNQRAHEIIDEKNGLRLSSAGLAAHEPSQTRRLRDLVREVVSVGSSGLLPISRGADLRPLLVLAFPLTSSAAADAVSSHFACGVIFVSDPDRVDDPSVGSLRQAFDLTYREAQTAIAVARGQGLQAAADMMGVALTTARSQLQQVFVKTGTRHQAELARLVHRSLGPLRLR
jgi:DNA-binding CsgD family transcriptional regulator